jgi:endoglucanase
MRRIGGRRRLGGGGARAGPRVGGRRRASDSSSPVERWFLLDRGINLGNVLDARAGTRPEPSPGAAALAGAGFRTVRVPVCWTDHLDSDGSIDAGFAARVDAVVDELLAHELEVIVDVHHFDAVHADPAGAAPVLADLWRGLAQRYADHPPALAFELLNEPRAPITPATWNELAANTLAAVRDVDVGRRVMIGPARANTLDALEELRVRDDPGLTLTVHYYAPFRFTHQGAWWEPGADAWIGTTWGDDADQQAVTADLERAAAWARRHGRPLFIGEFGTHEAADRGSRLRWTRWVRHEAERLGLGWCYWALGTEFRLMRRGGSWDADLLDALLGTSP